MKTTAPRIVEFALAAFMAFFSATAFAEVPQTENGPNHYREPGFNPNRDYVNQHFAEHVDPFTGNLMLSYVDVFLPGAGGFDIKVQRTYNLLKSNDVNSPFGRGWDIHFGRVKNSNLPCSTIGRGGRFTLELPDGSSQTFYNSNGVGNTSPSDEFITVQLWKARCNTGNAGGMIVYAPNGTQYEMTDRDAPGYWHATKIIDRNGNYMTISYVNAVAAGRRVVSQVTTSDLRTVTFQYSAGNNDRLESISANGISRTYTVEWIPGPNYNRLNSVSRPGGAPWQYEYADLGVHPINYALKKVTYPTNGTLIYDFDWVNFIPGKIDQAIVVAQKKSSDGGTWTYSYTPSTGSGVNDKTTVTVSSTKTNGALFPSQIVTVYEHAGYGTVNAEEIWKIGTLMSKKINAEETETYEWTSRTISNNTVLKPEYGIQKYDSVIRRPVMTMRKIERTGEGSYTTTYSNFDSFHNPTTITEVGNKTRIKTLTYYNNSTAWIVGLTESESTGVVTTSRVYDGKGNVSSSTEHGVTTTYAYSNGDMTRRTDANGNVTNYGSHYRGIPQAETRPASVSISRNVSSAGNVLQETDGMYAWNYEYDDLNRITKITPPNIATSPVIVAYSDSTRTMSVTRGTSTEVRTMDEFGRLASVLRNGSVLTGYSTDVLGRRTKVTWPGQTSGTSYTLDALGRISVATVTGKDGSSSYQTSYVYTATGTQITRARGPSDSVTTTYLYDRYGNPDEGYLTRISNTAMTTDMTRDVLGLMGSVSQGGITRDYGYDGHRFLTSIGEPETGTTLFGRDSVGNLISKTVGGNQIKYGYDGLNRQTSITHNGSAGSVSIAYNARGQVTKVTNPFATRSYEYDSNGNLKSDTVVVDGKTLYVTYDYDNLDTLKSITYPLGKGTISYNPDAFGRPQAATPYLTLVDHFDASGNLKSLTYANGVTLTYGEDQFNHPDSIQSAAVGINLKYSYDGVGNLKGITSQTANYPSQSFGYDAADRLTDWGQGTIQYSAAGNILKQQFGSYVLDYDVYTNNQLKRISGTKPLAFEYDGMGNTTRLGDRFFKFDNASNLTNACVSNCNAQNPQYTIGYTYDGKGMRVSEDKDGRKTYFFHSASNDLLFEYSPFQKRWKKHVYLQGKRIATESGTDASASTTVLSGTPQSAVCGDPVKLTATLSSGSTGDVEFFDVTGGDISNGATLLSKVLSIKGKALFTLTPSAAASRTFKARYLGDEGFLDSVSQNFVLTVSKRPTTVTVSTPPVLDGQPTVVTASVTGCQPGGVVHFFQGGVEIGSAAVAGGNASIFVTLSSGAYSLSAQYEGDANNTSSISPTVTVLVQKVVNDFDGDGKSDLVWQNADGTLEVWRMSGAQKLASTTYPAFTGQYALSVADFNGDGKDDMFWRSSNVNTTPDPYQLWLMNGVQRLAPPTNFSLADIPLDRRPQGVADVDGDKKGDLVFVHGEGGVSIWLMDGASHSASNVLSPGFTYLLRHVGDFNADGKDELLLERASNYELWFMGKSGTQATLDTKFDIARPAAPNPAMKIYKVADFNGDGKADLLWASDSATLSGTSVFEISLNVYSQSTGPAFASRVAVTGPAGMFVTHVADFNGDGKSDLVWQGGSGAISVMLMNGTTPISTGVITVTDSLWRVAGVGDFNGDGKSDLVLAYPDGTHVIKFMNGISPIGTAVILAAGESKALVSGDGTNLIPPSVPPTVTLAFSQPGNVFPQGTSVTLNATVSEGVTSVVFYNGKEELVGQGPTLALNSLSPGIYSITARVWAGNNTMRDSAAIVFTITNDPMPTTITLTAPSSALLGETVALTATIDGGMPNVPPEGLVEFRNGNTVLGVSTLSDRTALFVMPVTEIGTYTFTAKYLGNVTHLTSTSSEVTMQVGKTQSTIGFTTSADLILSGQQVVLAAAVNGYQPSGLVRFFDNNVEVGSVALENGVALLPRSFTIGSHTLRAVYEGNTNNLGSTVEISRIVAANSTTVLAATPSTGFVPSTVILTATVSGNNPIGPVIFKIGNTVIGSSTLVNGVATLSWKPKVGAYDVVAEYVGDGNNDPNSSAPVHVIFKFNPALLQLIFDLLD